ncbi:MAG TPA: prepilin-type N-terminal cleavage/methylation domain-containing protein [Candidatus Anoxymicrobiaceae bacterium]
MTRLRGGQVGFTLIEIMIVILIIAILVAIAVPVFIAAMNNSKRRTCQSNMRTIDSSINSYRTTIT